MTKFLLSVLAIFTVASAAFVAVPAEQPLETAIIHYDKLVEGPVEGTAKDVELMLVTGLPGQPSAIHLANMKLVPRKITLRVLGLSASEYDVYMDTNPDFTRRKGTVFAVPGEPPPPVKVADFLLGSRTKEELEAGIPVYLPGSKLTDADRDYARRLVSRTKAAAAGYPSSGTLDQKRVRAGLDAVADWAETQEITDQFDRTSRIIIAPRGKSFGLPLGAIPVSMSPESLETHTLGEDVQRVRVGSATEISDPMCSNDSLQALTPVDFDLNVPQISFTPGKHVVQATLKNWTDRKISAKVRLFAPSGWKVKPLSGELLMPGYGKSAVAKFEVIAPKAASKNPVFSASATLNVEGIKVKFLARAPK